MTAYTWFLLMLLSLVWGGSFLFNAIILRELGVLTTVLLRVGLGGMLLTIFLRLQGLKFPAVRHWGDFVIMGFLNNALPFTLIVYGQQSIESGLASIFNAATPLSTLLLAHFLIEDERINLRKLVGIGIGITGICLLIGVEMVEGVGSHVVAELAVILATVSYALAGIFAKRRLRDLDPSQSATGMLMGASTLMLPVAFWIEGVPERWLSTQALLAILGLATLSTAVAYLLYFRILQLAGATNLLLVTLLVPVSANLLGVLVLHESLSAIELLGMTTIGLGLLIVDGRLFRNWT